MIAIVDWVVALLVLVGAAFSVISAIGLARLPDIFTRSHAATKAATLGVLCVVLGAFMFFMVHTQEFSLRFTLTLVFVFVTAPVGGHLIARAAYNSGVPLAEGSSQDALKKSRSESRSYSEKNTNSDK
ncbi:monovalent cation/H(+) antiporter subunit G [Marinococcus halophilus]|uniref:monovalent cation/H(+) antiporter subunit G n=1 Tax=Marinococcus halophilus TaxID=1371 RepID=UPI0015C47ACD|nr:monovalent cation/H(+) antiporter subunit G [Marinococcus halophilus]